jgi:C4-dicarboxylate transporter DctQ subunit
MGFRCAPSNVLAVRARDMAPFQAARAIQVAIGNSGVKKIMKKALDVIIKIEEMFLGYALLAIAVVAAIQVVLRYFFGIAYDWVDEGSRYMTILITFMGAGVCVRYGAHFSMDALVQYSPDRIKHLLKTLANSISALIMTVAFYYSWIQIGKLHRFGATTPAFQMPMYIPYIPIGIFTAVIALRFLLQAIKHGAALVKNEPYTVQTGGH